jgi:glycosyltransferase involved in cell wall biosynthesis
MKILWCSDGVTPTGFSRVAHSVIQYFPPDWEVHHLAINYRGDPHNYRHHIYPAMRAGDYDVWGFSRLKEFTLSQFDLIFVLNDIWVIDQFLDQFKKQSEELPPIITYFPVDAEGFDSDWFRHKDIVSCYTTYTEFGKSVIEPFVDDKDIAIVPHGNDNSVFYQIHEDRKKAKIDLFSSFPHLLDSFIVLNANRNQPRKRIDIAMEGFSLFAQDKPDNVYYYHHGGLKDVGWDIVKLSRRYGIDKRLVTTANEQNIQQVPVELLNLIYNATDVGLNTSMGEGWGLTASEHAATGAPQIVPDHSACKELFEDCGLLIPVSSSFTYENTLTIGRVVSPEDVAEQLNILYGDSQLYELLAKSGKEKFTSDEYSWEAVSKQFQKLFLKYANNVSK